MKIEKCPFCGRAVAEITNRNDLEECRHFEKYPATEPYVCVVCNMHEGGCGASSGYYDSEADAIAAWNRRAQPENEALTCEWCADNYDHRHKTMFRKGSDWNYEAKYCDMCGKRLEEHHEDD